MMTPEMIRTMYPARARRAGVARPTFVGGLLVLLVALVASLTAFLAASARDTDGEGSPGLIPEAHGARDFGDVPAFELTSQTGETVAHTDLLGKVWVADFIFTRCSGLCPRMSERMADLNAALADHDDIRFVSFSVDPEHDTPERLELYARSYLAKPDRWLFLTGETETVFRVSEEGFHLSVARSSPEAIRAGAEAVSHSKRFVLVDREGRIRGYFDGTDETEVDALAARAEELLAASP